MYEEDEVYFLVWDGKMYRSICSTFKDIFDFPETQNKESRIIYFEGEIYFEWSEDLNEWYEI